MAFEMYADSEREYLHETDEYLLALVRDASPRYPRLSKLSHMFYGSPRLSLEESGKIVHELIELLSSNGGTSNKPLAHLVLRLLPFFSRAYRNATEIRCCGN